MIGGGVGGYIRNLSRGSGYGLRGRRKTSGPGDGRPVGPKLTQGPGRRGVRARARSLGVAGILFTIVFVAFLAAIAVMVMRPVT